MKTDLLFSGELSTLSVFGVDAWREATSLLYVKVLNYPQ